VRHLGFAAGFRWLPAFWRLAVFLGLWLILIGGPDPANRPAGIVAIFAATWASLRLLPPGGARVAPAALARLALRFLRQSIVAGWDVAWRALDPRLPLRPGFVVYPARLPRGPALNTFCTLTSLAPGTLPAGPDENGAILVHSSMSASRWQRIWPARKGSCPARGTFPQVCPSAAMREGSRNHERYRTSTRGRRSQPPRQ
jgi:multicomponent Na+:H+ antiporter subunit E